MQHIVVLPIPDTAHMRSIVKRLPIKQLTVLSFNGALFMGCGGLVQPAAINLEPIPNIITLQ